VDKEEMPLGSVYIPYVKGISEIFNDVGNHYNLRTVFKTKYTFRYSHRRTRLERDMQQMSHCIYSIPFGCGCYALMT
jgi:hypothetical protein